GLGSSGAAYGSGGNGAFGAERELAGQQFLSSAFAHDQHDEVGCGAADLKADAAAFDADGGGRRPAGSGPAAARDIAFAELAADDEGSGLEGGNNYDAVGIRQHVLRDALVGRRHNFGEHGRGLVEPFGRFVVLGQQGRDRQSSRQYHSHKSPFRSAGDPGGFGRRSY